VFRNSYWLRNPTSRPRNIFDYDENGQELTSGPAKRKRIEQFRQAFLKDAVASAHFQNPEQAWEAGFALNDAASATWPSICAAVQSRRSTPATGRPRGPAGASRWSSAWHYYVSDNPEQSWKSAGAAARQVAGCLIDCAGETALRRTAARPAGDSDNWRTSNYRDRDPAAG